MAKILAKKKININIGSLKIPLEAEKVKEIELSDRQLEVIVDKLGEKKGISENITIDGKTLKKLAEEKKPKPKEGGSDENKDKKNPKSETEEKVN